MNELQHPPCVSTSWGSYLRFLWAGLVKHGQTGGVVPSQRFLIRKMLEPVPPRYGGQIIELGAGTGALTRRLAVRCPRARILACELNPDLARGTGESLAAGGLQGRVELRCQSAEGLLHERLQPGRPKPAFVISGIPLANLGRQRSGELLDLISRVLAGTGLYVQFQHSLFHRQSIKARFARVRTVPVFLNFPPAVVYYAWRPVGQEP